MLAKQGDYVIQVVDDDDAVRDSLQLLLGSAGYRTRGWSSGPALLASAATLEPGCVIVDVRMPDMDGVTLLGKLRERGIRHPVIVMTGHADVPLAVRAMRAGAIDFIEKPFADAVILQSLEAALDRGLHPEARHAADAATRMTALTPREREVLQALVAGLPNKSIAYDLGISARTVEIHRSRVMEKMQARSLSELVRLGLAAGINPDVT